MMRPHYQEDLPFNDSRSSTEVEEALIPEKHNNKWPDEAPIQPKHRSSILNIHLIIEFFLLLLISILLLDRLKHPPTSNPQITSDITHFSPSFSSKLTSFVPDLSFIPANTSTFWDSSVKDKWLSIVPRGLGYVRVDDPSQYTDLPTPIHDYPNETVYTTSMPHQLHCLYNILEVYAAMTSENPRGVVTEMTFHLRHCFEYLRLSIMCCGDVALEGAQTSFPEGFPGSDGWDATHVCRNYDEVTEYLEGNRATDRKWIGGADEIH